MKTTSRKRLRAGLDVHVERTKTNYETSVYRKPTFAGQYLRWESFSPIVMKLQGYRHNKRRALIQLLLALTPNKNEAIHATNRNGNKHETG